jgi:hypothetical protein
MASGSSRSAGNADAANLRLPPPALTGSPDLQIDYNTAPESLNPRTFIETPFLIVWILLTGFFIGFVPWVLFGLGVVAFSLVMRKPYRAAHLKGQAGVYRALGIGQILLGISFVYQYGPLWPLVGAYCAAAVLAWLVVELSHLELLPKAERIGD